MCNFKHLPRINWGHYWAPPRAAWCAHWSTGNVSHSPIQWSCVIQCALIQADTILIPLLIYKCFIHHKIHPILCIFDHNAWSKYKKSMKVWVRAGLHCFCGSKGMGFSALLSLCSDSLPSSGGPCLLPVLICINIYFFKTWSINPYSRMCVK